MGEAVRVYSCRRCGREYRKRRSLTRQGYCPAGCGIEVMLENAAQLHAGEGPAVDRWLEGIAKHLGVGGARGDPRQSDAG